MSEEHENAIAPAAKSAGNGRAPAVMVREPELIDGSFEAAGGVGIATYLHALRRRWLAALAAGVICAVLAAGLAWMFRPPETYEAVAYLKVASSEQRLLYPTAISGADYATFKSTQQQLIQNPFVLNAALRDREIADLPIFRVRPPAETEEAVSSESGVLGVLEDLRNAILTNEHEDPVEWIQEHLEVSFAGNSEIMEVRLAAEEKNSVVPVLNAIVKAYMDEVAGKESDTRQSRLTSLEDLHDDKVDEIRRKWEELKRSSENLGTSDSKSLSLAQQQQIQEVTLFRNELAKLQIDQRRAQSELNRRKEEINNEKTTSAEITEAEWKIATRNDSTIAEFQAEMDRLNARTNSYRTLRASAAAPILRKIESRIAEVEQQIDDREAELRRELEQLKQQQIEEQAEAEIKRLEDRVAAITALENMYRSDIESRMEQFNDYGQDSIGIEFIKAELALLENSRDKMAQEIERIRIELRNNNAPRITELNKAEAARRVESVSPYVLTAVAGLAGLFLPGFGIIWLDVRKRHLNSCEEISRSLQVDVLGAVPYIPPRHLRLIHKPSKQRERWKRVMAESSDAIAANLLHRAESERQQVILISSATAGEGKTTLARHLAMSLAETGHKVLLLDFDLRRPALHRGFNVPPAPGIREILHDQAEPDEAVRETGVENLWILPAGEFEYFGLNRFSRQRLAVFFDLLRNKFDFVIVDSSPVLPAVDTRLVGKFVDGVVLSVLRDVSQSPRLHAACEILESFDIPLIGAVMTGSGPEAYYPVMTN